MINENLVKSIVRQWRKGELTSDEAIERISGSVRSVLDETNKQIKFYPDLLKQANSNGFDSVYEFLLAVYEQWDSVSAVAKYIKRSRVGTLRLMRNLMVPVNMKKGGSNNKRYIG